MAIYHQRHSSRFLLVSVLLLCYTGGTCLTVKSSVGEDAVLPCDVGITTDVDNLTVEWFRTDRPGDQYVYFWRGRVEVLDDKNPSYKGRTSLFQDEVKKVFLKLTRVKPSDEGDYICHIDEFYKKSTVQLTVGTATTKVKRNHVVGKVGQNITLQTGVSKVPHDSNLLWSFGPEKYVLAHSFSGQLHNQTMDKFRGRIHLDKETGSLLITNLTLTDTGIYDGQVINRASSYHHFKVTIFAPVVSVSMELEGDTLTCSSRGIYPEPTLTWSTSPPMNHTFNYSTTVTKTTEQLYHISSSLTFTAEDSHLDYICSVGTEGGRKTVTLSRLPPVHFFLHSADVAIPCKAPSSTLKDFSVTWSFNHIETILSYFSTNPLPLVTDKWKERVRGVSESGALQLSASSVKLEGVYRCELCRADDTYVSYTSLTHNVMVFRIQENRNRGHVGVIIPFIIIIIIALAIMYLWRARSRARSRAQNI